MSEKRSEAMLESSKKVFGAIFESDLSKHDRQGIIYACIMSEAFNEGKSSEEFLNGLFNKQTGSSEEKNEGDIITEVLRLFSGHALIDIVAMIGVIIKTVVKNSPISTDEILNMFMGMPED